MKLIIFIRLQWVEAREGEIRLGVYFKMMSLEWNRTSSPCSFERSDVVMNSATIHNEIKGIRSMYRPPDRRRGPVECNWIRTREMVLENCAKRNIALKTIAYSCCRTRLPDDATDMLSFKKVYIAVSGSCLSILVWKKKQTWRSWVLIQNKWDVKEERVGCKTGFAYKIPLMSWVFGFTNRIWFITVTRDSLRRRLQIFMVLNANWQAFHLFVLVAHKS